MAMEIELEWREDSGRTRELVFQTERLIESAHQSRFHQNEWYPVMLYYLASLADRIRDEERLLKISK